MQITVVILFWNISVFYYSSDMPQGKRNLIHSIKNLVYELHHRLLNGLTLFRMLSQKCPCYQFSSVASANVGTSSQNFLGFWFNRFGTPARYLNSMTYVSPKILYLNQDLFWKTLRSQVLSSLYKIDIMISK